MQVAITITHTHTHTLLTLANSVNALITVVGSTMKGSHLSYHFWLTLL